MVAPPPDANPNYQPPQAEPPPPSNPKKFGDATWLGIVIGLAVLVYSFWFELDRNGVHEGKNIFTSAVGIVFFAGYFGLHGRRRLGLGCVISLGLALLLFIVGWILLWVGLLPDGLL